MEKQEYIINVSLMQISCIFHPISSFFCVFETSLYSDDGFRAKSRFAHWNIFESSRGTSAHFVMRAFSPAKPSPFTLWRVRYYFYRDANPPHLQIPTHSESKAKIQIQANSSKLDSCNEADNSSRIRPISAVKNRLKKAALLHFVPSNDSKSFHASQQNASNTPVERRAIKHGEMRR